MGDTAHRSLVHEADVGPHLPGLGHGFGKGVGQILLDLARILPIGLTNEYTG